MDAAYSAEKAVTVGDLSDVLAAAGAHQIAAMFASYDRAATVQAIPTTGQLLLVVDTGTSPVKSGEE